MNISAEIKAFHRRAIVIDAHCDSLLHVVNKGRHLGERSENGHLDFPRLTEGGVDVQFFAAYIEPEYKPDRALKRTLQLFDAFFKEIEKHPDQIRQVCNAKEIEQAKKDGVIGALLAIEGGEALNGDLSVLRILHRLGVRSIGLTWNERNDIADGVGEERTRGGLTNFGVDVVKEMNRLGILVDVSHLSEPGFWDVVEVSEKPFVATHSNAKGQCMHRRNLTDEQLRALAEKGGVTGMNFAPNFVKAGGATLDDLLDHIDYIKKRFTVDIIGLGSDFDGIENTPKGLEDSTCFPNITAGLFARGYKESEIEKILGGNFLRVIREVIG